MASDRIQSENAQPVSVVCVKRLPVLESAKMHLKILGCLPLPINQQNWPRRLRKLPINKIHIALVFLILILNFWSTCWFYICEVKTFVDFLESVFWISRAILSLALYSMLIWHKAEFINLFNGLEESVDKSETIKNDRNLQIIK